MCCRNDSSVINSIDSGQLLLSYNVFVMARLKRLDKLVSHEHKILEQYFKRHPTTKFNKTPSAKYILL